MTAEEYRRFLEADFGDVALKDMKDIRDVRIDRRLSKEGRIQQYLKQVGNPYLIRAGDVKIKVRFADEGITFEQAFEEMLLNM